MAEYFQSQYMALFGTTNVTKAQEKYFFQVDKYHNIQAYVQTLEMNNLPVDQKAIKVRVDSGLQAGAKAAEAAGLSSGGQASKLKFLQDVQKLYSEIKDFEPFVQQMKEVESVQSVAVQAGKQQYNKMDKTSGLVAPAIAAEGFYAGAQAGGTYGNFILQQKQSLKESGLNLAKQQEEDYLKISNAAAGVSLLLQKFIREGAVTIESDKYFVKIAQVYDHWATTNKLSDEQRGKLDPVARAQQSIEQERESARAREQEKGFSLGW